MVSYTDLENRGWLAPQQASEMRAEIERLRAAIRQIELNSRAGEPLMLKLNWLARQALNNEQKADQG